MAVEKISQRGLRIYQESNFNLKAWVLLAAFALLSAGCAVTYIEPPDIPSIPTVRRTVTNVNLGNRSGPIPGVTVILTNKKTGRQYRRTTDSEGNATFPMLPTGDYYASIWIEDRHYVSKNFESHELFKEGGVNIELEIDPENAGDGDGDGGDGGD